MVGIEVDPFHPAWTGETGTTVQNAEIIIKHEVVRMQQKFELIGGVTDDVGEFLVGAIPLFHFFEGEVERSVGKVTGADLCEFPGFEREDRIRGFALIILLLAIE